MDKLLRGKESAWHKSEAAEVLRTLDTDAEFGLSDEEAARRLAEQGPNVRAGVEIRPTRYRSAPTSPSPAARCGRTRDHAAPSLARWSVEIACFLTLDIRKRSGNIHTV